jgi:hypothetical protein
MNIDEFLERNVEGYLFADLRSMKGINLPKDAHAGGCGYPLLMATFAGIELLGGLLTLQPFDRGRGRDYFKGGWLCIYPSAPRAGLAEQVYKHARHGLAHTYVPKRNLTVHRGPGSHLERDASTFYINAVQFADDLMSAYDSDFKPMLGRAEPPNRATIQARLGEMVVAYETEMELGASMAVTMVSVHPPSSSSFAASKRL